MWKAPSLKGVVAVVSGASRGVGRGIALVLGECGATVYVTGRSVRGVPTTDSMPGTIEDTAHEVTNRGGIGIAVRCDHRIQSDVDVLMQRVKAEQNGRLDLLVNNSWAGYENYDMSSFNRPLWETGHLIQKRWEHMFEGGLKTHIITAAAAAPLMIARRSGVIIETGFHDAKDSYLGALMYDIAKNSMHRLAFGLSRELAQHNVTALMLSLGFTRTERVLAAGISQEELATTESTEYSGRAVACLIADKDIHTKTGRCFSTGELAKEYDFVDIDGRWVPPFQLPENLGSH